MLRTLPVLLLALALTACGGDAEDAPPAEPDAQETPAPEPPPAPAEEAPAADGEAADGEAGAGGATEGGDADATNPALLDPNLASEEAPATYTVKFTTTKGDILIDVTREWAPNGADRFYNLVKIGYFDDVAVFRVIGGFMAQLGIHGDPAVAKVWRNARIDDDPVTQSNTAGMITFATAGPNTRTTQVFMNFDDNANLDGMGFAPFGKLRSMDVLNQLFDGYGEGAPRGRGPHQGRLQSQGNAYLKAEFPNLDYIVKATIVED